MTKSKGKDLDKEKEKEKDKEKPRHPSFKSSRKVRSSSSKERSSSYRSSRGGEGGDSEGIVDEQRWGASTTSLGGDGVGSAGSDSRKTTSSYPTFSKAHSKEVVGSREDMHKPKNISDPFTPDPTDLATSQERGDVLGNGVDKGVRNIGGGAAPPSPPLTATEPPGPEVKKKKKKKKESNGELSRAADEVEESLQGGRKSADEGYKYGASPRPQNVPRSGSRGEADENEYLSGSEYGEKVKDSQGPGKIRKKEKKYRKKGESPHRKRKTAVRIASTGRGLAKSSSVLSRTLTDSDATVAPDHKTFRNSPGIYTKHDSLPSSMVDSSSQTPTQSEIRGLPGGIDLRSTLTPVLEVYGTADSAVPPPTHPGSVAAPPPPPPPPPAMSLSVAPQVDYLLLNGGLPNAVPRNLLATLEDQKALPVYQSYVSPRAGPQRNHNVQKLFSPFQEILDSYNKVLSKHGSLAVATGYRSVARRLLDRLEAVFARNISSEVCTCVMCKMKNQDLPPDEEDTGVGWGEILEFVSGRRELPQWPPFASSKVEATTGLGINAGMEPSRPMQKIDVDVPEEYREHFVRQSKKTKQTVQNWLSSQPDLPSSPPQEVDDDTLTFAILTHLESEKRPIFTALMRDMSVLPVSRAPTPLERPRRELMEKTALALQRLYRLSDRPRDPECAIYLLQSPELHGVLATLAAVSAGEWDILVSGRFDGFLWGGVDNGTHAANPRATPSFPHPASRAPSVQQSYSRTTTPFTPGMNGLPRGATPSFSRSNTPYNQHNHYPQQQSQQSAHYQMNGRAQTPAAAAPTPSVPATPAPASGVPVQVDEETELAVLAEVEREIFLGMEALEDAFETLHLKAEGVRQALRERSTAMAMAAQARRGPGADAVEARIGTPGMAMGGVHGLGDIGAFGYGGLGGLPGMAGTPGVGVWAWENETDDGLDEIRSEILPDDSASNISTSRRRRPERRNERKTPAPVEEADEE